MFRSSNQWKHYLNTAQLTHYHDCSLSLKHQTLWKRNYCSSAPPANIFLTLRSGLIDTVLCKVTKDFSFSNPISIFQSWWTAPLDTTYPPLLLSRSLVFLPFVDMVLLSFLCILSFSVVILKGFFLPTSHSLYSFSQHTSISIFSAITSLITEGSAQSWLMKYPWGWNSPVEHGEAGH